jgi:hypothetical protein
LSAFEGATTFLFIETEQRKDTQMTQVKSYTRERDAKYAAKQAGLTLDLIEVSQNEAGRWYYTVKPVEPVEVVKVAAGKKEAPEGKRAAVVDLAKRPEGATRAELIELTGWSKAPWKWLFSNPQGTGICDRYNLEFRCEQSGRNSRYYVGKQVAA